MTNTLTLTPSTINDLVAKTIATSRAAAIDGMIRELGTADVDWATSDALRVTIKDRVGNAPIPPTTYRRHAIIESPTSSIEMKVNGSAGGAVAGRVCVQGDA